MPAAKTYPIDGLLKHAQVCRVLCKNNVHPRQFYIITRVCAEHLPTATLIGLRHELGAKSSSAIAAAVSYMRKKKLVQVSHKHEVTPTLEGWAFFMLLLAEMERPPRENTICVKPKKLKFGNRPYHPGKKAGYAKRKLNLVKLATKRGLSIWERCALASLPPYQRLDSGGPALSAPDSSRPTSSSATPQ